MQKSLQEEGLPVWDRDIKQFVCSNRIPVYNPVDDFLDHLPVWDGKERIRALVGQVPVSNPHWRGMDTRYANCSLPLLVGEQGCGKSTWCLNLSPPELREVKG